MPSVITEVDEAVVHAVDEARIGGGEDEGDEDRFFQSPVALFPIHVQPCGKKQSLQVRLEVRLTVRLAVRLAGRQTGRLTGRLTGRTAGTARGGRARDTRGRGKGVSDL